MKVSAVFLAAAVVLMLAGCSDGPDEERPELYTQEDVREDLSRLDQHELATPGESSAADVSVVDEVEQRFRDSYDWPQDPFWNAIEGFNDRDEPAITVVTSLYDKPENEAEASGICMAVRSVANEVSGAGSVYVTAGEGGRFLAEC